MVRGLDNTKEKRKPWKNRMQRDIILNKDLAKAYFQKGKVMGSIADKLMNKQKRKPKKK